MNKETYQRETLKIKQEINYLQEKKKQLTENYITKNSVFKIGDRVKVGNEFGYVISLELDHKDNVKPKCVKEKKDGSKSMHSLYVWVGEDVELAPKI